MITDIHTHILPKIDDGAKDTETALKLLQMMKKQGIKNVIATPHFYAFETNIEKFLDARNAAYQRVIKAAKEQKIKIPEIKLGAEVYYFNGIGNSEGIRELVLGNSNFVLFELANGPISDSVVRDVIGLYNNLGLLPVFAHIERFAHEKGFKKLVELADEGMALFQINAESVLEHPYKRITTKLIKQGLVSFLGTDTHSLNRRPPKMEAALKEIEGRFGADVKNRLIKNGNKFFEDIG